MAEAIINKDSHESLFESFLKRIIPISAFFLVLLLIMIFITLLYESRLSIKAFGIKYLFDQTWDPVMDKFGALPFLVGTIITSFLALIISLPFSLSLSIFLGEYYKEGLVSSFLKSAIELLAGIPSIIYGFWVFFILSPIIKILEIKYGFPPYGVGILTASIVLAIMIIPYSASIAREVMQLVPAELKEAGLSLGATRFEVIKKVIFPYAKSGIIAGILLSLGRALCETMAVTMVIGNSNFLPTNIFSPANTMASTIANEFTEASGDLYLSSLVELGLILFLVTMVINIIGKYTIKKMSFEE